MSINEKTSRLRTSLSSLRQHVLLKQIEDALGNTTSPEWATVMSTALLVGVGAGFGAVIFRWLIGTMQDIAFNGGGDAFSFLGDYYFFFIPALGGLIVGPLVYFFAREAKGHGVPEVMEAVALKEGRIRPRVAIVKSLASSICIGSGGSVGREGPIVQIGSALGSTVGQWLKLSPERTRSLVACGAAGGISATFNAPIAGSIFALEVILGELQAGYFGAVVISAVIADVIAHTFEGSLRAFPIPAYELVSSWELVLYAGLGFLAAVVAVLYAKTIYFLEDLFDDWKKFPEYFKPVVGGLILGGIGIICVRGDLTYTREGRTIPGVFGVGYELIEPALLGELAIGTALALLLLKLIATGFTLGSGGSGGVFAPSLFLGAMLGLSFGHIVHDIFPDSTAPEGAYALAGMAAVFAGSAHAPATAILILFEMTGDYKIILPLMFTTVISMLVSRTIEPESIYTLKLVRRGVRLLKHNREVDLLEGVKIGDVMETEFDTVPHTMLLHQLAQEFETTHHHGYIVVDDAGKLFGIVTLGDLEQAMLADTYDTQVVADIATVSGLMIGYPDEPMSDALWRIGTRHIGRMPVVDRKDPRQLVGVIRRHTVMTAYEQAITQRKDISTRLKTLREAYEGKVRVLEVDISVRHPFVGKQIQAIAPDLPTNCILVSIRRDHRVIIPRGSTTLQAGDHLITLAQADCAEDVCAALTHPPAAS